MPWLVEMARAAGSGVARVGGCGLNVLNVKEQVLSARIYSRSHLYVTLTVNSRRCTLRPLASHSPGSSTFSSVTVASGGISYEAPPV